MVSFVCCAVLIPPSQQEHSRMGKDSEKDVKMTRCVEWLP